MMPMVFCASLPPWPRLYRPADTSCRRRNQLSTRSGDELRNSQATISVSREPSAKPSAGDTKMNNTVFQMPAPISAPAPVLAITAPTMPPISACDELDGMPYHRVMRAAMSKLFREQEDVRELIKLKAIYEQLESITDRCEDVANLIEGIVLENS